MQTYPTVDESRALLDYFGWIVGETSDASTWLVTGTNREYRIHAEGATQSEAWWRACVQARDLGLLMPMREGAPVDEGVWLASPHFPVLFDYLMSGPGAVRTKGGRRKFRLLGCACCRVLLWHLPVRDCERRLVEIAEAFADGRTRRAEMEAARRERKKTIFDQYEDQQTQQAALAMLWTIDESAAGAAYSGGMGPVFIVGPEDRLMARERVCDLVREIFGNPFRPLERRAFPAHVVELARECYSAFPTVSDRFLILADALADLGEEQGAGHCRQPEHAKGCHVLDTILARS
jgi:hypothetical protein